MGKGEQTLCPYRKHYEVSRIPGRAQNYSTDDLINVHRILTAKKKTLQGTTRRGPFYSRTMGWGMRQADSSILLSIYLSVWCFDVYTSHCKGVYITRVWRQITCVAHLRSYSLKQIHLAFTPCILTARNSQQFCAMTHGWIWVCGEVWTSKGLSTC